MNTEAKQLVQKLRLKPLPEEGGFFRQTWQSSVQANQSQMAGSAIYFLMTDHDFSALHRLQTDEIWHFYAGDPISHLQLIPARGKSKITELGADLMAEQTPQLIVPAGVWQGARIMSGHGTKRGWALVGCSMAPAWNRNVFELGSRDHLLDAFPAARELVIALTR